MSDVLVKVEGVSKKFCRSLKRSLWYGVQDMISELNPLARLSAKGQEQGEPSALTPLRLALDPLPLARHV